MRRQVFFAFLPVLLLLNCQSFDSVIREPKLSIKSVDIAGISLSGMDLVVRVDVENPNVFSIPLPAIDWDLFINTAPFIKGSLKENQTIKQRQTVTIDFAVSVTYDGLYRSFKSLVETKEAAYEIALGVTFPIPFIADKVYHLNFSGAIPLPQLPKLSLGDVQVAKMDLTGIEMVCGIGVENPNRFPIPSPVINWDYGINGVPVVRGNVGAAGEIAAGASGVASVSLSVKYADIISAAASLRNAGEGSLRLQYDIPIPALESALSGTKNTMDIPLSIPMPSIPGALF
jgi:LEA14-like dessication related protein